MFFEPSELDTMSHRHDRRNRHEIGWIEFILNKLSQKQIVFQKGKIGRLVLCSVNPYASERYRHRFIYMMIYFFSSHLTVCIATHLVCWNFWCLCVCSHWIQCIFHSILFVLKSPLFLSLCMYLKGEPSSSFLLNCNTIRCIYKFQLNGEEPKINVVTSLLLFFSVSVPLTHISTMARTSRQNRQLYRNKCVNSRLHRII